MIDEANQHENVQGSASDTSEGAMGDATSTEAATTGEPNIDITPVATTIDGEPSAAFETVQAVVDDQAPSVTVDNAAALSEKDNEIKLLKSQLEERTNQCVRIAADFDNYRKRTQRERDDLELQVKCSTINELLPVVDNFERARSQIKPQTDQETTIHKSYQSVYKQLVDCLKRIELRRCAQKAKNLTQACMKRLCGNRLMNIRKALLWKNWCGAIYWASVYCVMHW